MSFWNSASPPGSGVGGIRLKRDYRFHGYLSFIRPTSKNRNFDQFKAPQRALNDGTTAAFFLIHSFEKPAGRMGDIDYGMNPRNGTYDYGLKDFNVKEVTVEVYDSYDPEGATDSNIGRIFWEWLKRMGYDARVIAAGSGGTAGRASSLDLLGDLESGQQTVLTIEIIDEDGIAVEKYNYLNPILSAFSFGKASYSTDNLPLISLTFQVASIEYVSLT